jgi:hypothetical protein
MRLLSHLFPYGFPTKTFVYSCLPTHVTLSAYLMILN